MAERGKGLIRTLLWAILAAGLLTLLAASGLLYRLDQTVSDALYQERVSQDGEIVLVGMDDRAIEDFGPFTTWTRDIYAQAIETLNADEELRPAAIAIDVLFTGENDPDLDAWLAEAAGAYGNVVTASAFTFGRDMVEQDNGEYGYEDFSILPDGSAIPYAALRGATTMSHINVMADRDGLLRHHLLRVQLPDGETVPSMALAASNLYRAHHGLPPVTEPPVDGHSFWYLPYTGLPGDFDEGISLSDLVLGDIDPEYFAGKIVLIGPCSMGMQDAYFTSNSHAEQMYGVEIHANAIQALLRGAYKREAGNGIQYVILFILLFLGFLGFWKRRVLLATALWGVLCGGWLLVCKLLAGQGLLLHALWVPSGVTILYIVCIALNYIQSAMEKQRVTNTFKRYVDPSVIRELLREGSESLDLGGKLTDIAVLFVDIRGFTTMSEVLTPPQIVEILNQYLTLTTQCVMENHGTLDKFVGDCTMAIWNAPLPQTDYVMNACKAAMAMVEGSRPLAEKLQKDYGRTVSFGVGVNVGPAVVGNIGAPMRMDYTAIGDTVNTAARLEANAPGGMVYISRAVADALGDRVRVTSLGDTIKLKGKRDGFEILKLEEILE